jgi:hypothetical protein
MCIFVHIRAMASGVGRNVMHHMPSRSLQLLLISALLAIVLMLGACMTPPPPPPSAAVITLDFLTDGITTRDQAMEHLGKPSREFVGGTGGQVLTFRIGRDAAGLHVASGAEDWYRYEICYSLVLSFGIQGALARHALVKVKGS